MYDASSACSVNLKESLIPDPVERVKPLNFYEKNELVLPDCNNPMKYILEDMFDFTKNENLKINSDKSKIMIFNPSKTYQFPPEMGFERDNNLEYVRNAKILGVIVTDN